MAAPWKQPFGIEHESFLERRFVHIALPCPWVRQIRHQPCVLELDVEGQRSRYIPDYLVDFSTGGAAVIEVKPDAFVAQHRPRLLAAARTFAERQVPFFVLTDQHLPERSARTARHWLRFARSAPVAAEVERLVAALRMRPSLFLTELEGVAVSEGTALHCLGRGIAVSSTGYSLTETTRLQFPPEEADACLQFERWFDCLPW